MTDIRISAGVCSVTAGAHMRLGMENTEPSGFELLVQQGGTIALDPYVIVDGRPADDTGHGANFATIGGSDTTVVFQSAPLPQDLDLGAWRRWLGRGEYLSPPANGGRRWWPMGTPAGVISSGATAQPEPRIALYTSIDPPTPALPTGRATYSPESPQIDNTYSYAGFETEMHRSAMAFNGNGHASIETERTFTETTIGIVAVFHPSTHAHYGIFASNEVDPNVGTPGEPLVLRYTHGRIDVFQAHVKVLSHETHKNAHQAVILLLSLSSADDLGRALIIDKTRTSKEFNIDNLDFVSFGGLVGAEGQNTAASPVSFTADMDLLELAIWDTALTFPQLEEKANLLSLAYGIAG